MTLSLQTFVENSTQAIVNFNRHDQNNIKNIIRLAIDHFQFKSKELLEKHNEDEYKVLYIANMAEENLLSKIVQLSTQDEETNIEQIYEGFIVRMY